MDFNYYSFVLNKEERIFYTYVTLDDEEDILSWALRYNFIKENDVTKCSNVRFLPPEEVQKRNIALYKEWWEHRERLKKEGQDVSCMLIPPTIGEVQLN